MKLTRSRRLRAAFAASALVVLSFVAAGVTSVSAAASGSTASVAATSASAAAVLSSAAWSTVELKGLSAAVLDTALQSAAAAVDRGLAPLPSTLTIIDYSKPSTEPRMWVYDVRTHELLFHEFVSHGRGSGKTMATSFSNVAESNMTSLGLFKTAEAYVGHNGYSLRLDGLERGRNDNARARAIVIHGAPYVNAATAKANGYLGRSLGCPAVRPEIARSLIDTVKGGGLVFAYYPSNP
jgi:hypothetical protein